MVLNCFIFIHELYLLLFPDTGGQFVFLSAVTFINTAADFIRNSEHALKEELTLQTLINLQSVNLWRFSLQLIMEAVVAMLQFFYHYWAQSVTINTLLMGQIHHEQLESGFSKKQSTQFLWSPLKAKMKEKRWRSRREGRSVSINLKFQKYTNRNDPNYRRP